MRVLLSMLALRPGGMGGAETYARGLSAALAEQHRLDYECLVPTGAEDAAGGLPVRADPLVRADAGGAARIVALVRSAAGTRAHADVVHYPFTAPLPPTRLPYVVTVQDLLHREQPELLPKTLGLYRRLAYDAAARRAAAVVVATQYVRDSVAARLRIDADRIHVAPYGLDHEQLSPGAVEREPFLLYPARAWPHKNHERLFEAFALVRERHPELRLVLTGDDFTSLPPGVESAGRVSRTTLISLYQRAAALVFPSLNEGFGFPPLEAMACGCPVAVAATTSLPEVCGDAAEYFEPTDAADIARAVDRLFGDPRPEERVARGIAQAGTFTWRRMADAHERVYSLSAQRVPSTLLHRG